MLEFLSTVFSFFKKKSVSSFFFTDGKKKTKQNPVSEPGLVKAAEAEWAGKG